jgi:hypothetical protein
LAEVEQVEGLFAPGTLLSQLSGDKGLEQLPRACGVGFGDRHRRGGESSQAARDTGVEQGDFGAPDDALAQVASPGPQGVDESERFQEVQVGGKRGLGEVHVGGDARLDELA